MANLYNDFNSKADKVAEERANVEQLLVKLEDDIRRLKIDFGVYFNGNLRRAPHEARGRVEAIIKRLSDSRNMSYVQRYQFNNIVARYNSYRELWRRTFKARGEMSF